MLTELLTLIAVFAGLFYVIMIKVRKKSPQTVEKIATWFKPPENPMANISASEMLKQKYNERRAII